MGTNYHGFRDLIVYKKSYSLGIEVFELTKTFPKEERYSLSDQIRRSSRSVPVNISEAWAVRRYPKSFISKLFISYGEASETSVWLDYACDHRYISDNIHKKMFDQYEEVQKMLRSMIQQPEKFCYHK